MTFVNRFGNNFLDFLFSICPKLISATIVIILGFLLAKLIKRILGKSLNKLSLDYSLRNFLIKTSDYIIKILVLISAVTMLGIPTTGLIAALSAAAVAISLALKDSLGNLAGGILLLISRPFTTGDTIGIGDKTGNVKCIDMIHTTLTTLDNVEIIIPNGSVMNQTVSNYSKQEFRRIILKFPIGLHDNFEEAKKVITHVVSNHDLILHEPDLPFVRVSGHDEHSTIIVVRAWCKEADYWTLYYDLLEQVKTALENEGFFMPYRQIEIHAEDKND